MQIRTLNLPTALIHAISSDIWSKNGIGWKSNWTGQDLEQFKSLFPLCTYFRPALYSYDLMKSESEAFVVEVQEDDVIYIGQTNSDYWPGDIDPSKAVLIGETAQDSPIALDYRFGSEPIVIYLCDMDNQSYWVKAADNIQEFLNKIGFTAQI